MSTGRAPADGGRSFRRTGRRMGILFLAAFLLAAVFLTPWQGQAAVAVVALLVALLSGRWSGSRRATLALLVASCVVTGRYAFWRAVGLWHFLDGGGGPVPAGQIGFALLLFAAEGYAILTQVLGYFQMAFPLRRPPLPLPANADTWPAVDLLIPTLNEPLEIVKYTALAAANLDWPPDRLHVLVLDDGHREELRVFCAEAGVGYLSRDTREGAKAGNLNAGLRETQAAFVAVFDADHAPVRSFLQLTLGWFGAEPGLALVQTPQHLYSPDPLERNLRQFRRIPNEGELFFGVVQDGNDLWDAAYFCGTGAVLRRSALDGVGGFATDTVTEDAHTSLRLQKAGWSTAYLNLPLAAGLATGTLAEHLRQRQRWARGMTSILRREGPLFAAGLTWPQRLCYFQACIYFLGALPRLIFLLAPFAFLALGRVTIPASWLAVVALAGPHLLLGYAANARLHGRHRFSFWNEIQETLLAPFLLLPIAGGLFDSRAGAFTASGKGSPVERPFFNARAAWPLVGLFAANACGLLFAVLRLWRPQTLAAAVRGSAGMAAGAVWTNVGWAVFNLMILSVAIGVAREGRQRRHRVRLPKVVPAMITFADERRLRGATADISSGGLLLRLDRPETVPAGVAVSVMLLQPGRRTTLPGTLVAADGQNLRVQFDPLTSREEEALAAVLYAAADSWVGWGTAAGQDRPLRSLFRVAWLAVAGVPRALAGMHRTAGLAASILVSVVLLCAGLGGAAVSAAHETSPAVSSSGPHAAAASGDAGHFVTIRSTISLKPGAGSASIILLGPGAGRALPVRLPPSVLVERAALRLHFRTAGWPSPKEVVAVFWNGVSVGAIPLPRLLTGLSGTTVAIPPEFIVERNDLRLVLQGDPGTSGRELKGEGAGVVIDTGASGLEIIARPIVSARVQKGAEPAKLPGSALTGWSTRASFGRLRSVAGGVYSAAGPRLEVSLLVVAGVAGGCVWLAVLLGAELEYRARMRLGQG